VRVVWCLACWEACRDEVLFGFAPGVGVSEAEGCVMASPKKRKRLEAGEPRHPWRDDPSLSSRPPFEAGNLAAFQHGAMSPKHLAPIAAELERGIVEVAPWCARPAFQPAVKAWAIAEATCELYREWFKERGLWDQVGEPLSGLVRWDRAEARASALRKRLSIDPSSFASFLSRLATTSAITDNVEGLAEVQREGRAIVAARERQLAAGDDDDGEGDDE
jgi:hypothetical protein